MDLGLADSLAPQSLKRQGPYWRERFKDAHVAIVQLQERIDALERDLATTKEDRNHILRRTVTLTVAEEARRRAAAGMRERAATLMEYPTGVPNAHSEVIRELPDPKPRWIQ